MSNATQSLITYGAYLTVITILFAATWLLRLDAQVTVPLVTLVVGHLLGLQAPAKPTVSPTSPTLT